MWNSKTFLGILTSFLLLNLSVGSAFAAISQAEAAGNTLTPLDETREILDRASFIVFQSATTVQKIQTLSVDKATSELLKNYMASMIYIPRAMSLPSDAEALDEPWLATNVGRLNEDGLVVPNIGDEDEGSSNAKLDIDAGAAKFLKLLKPVQNAMVSSPFGWRWGRPHQGIDLAAPLGTPIVAAEDGKVVFSGWQAGYGNFIVVDHGHGYQTHYAHCSKLIAHAGQRVSQGQIIAKVGNTGHSTGPHLHFEVVANGIHRNPVKFLNRQLAIVSARRD